MTLRTYTDGKPFYCKTCGLGFGEWAACEDNICELETVEEAEARAARLAAQPTEAA